MNNVYHNGLYPRRGEIYYIKKGDTICTGSETWSNRHAVIVTNNKTNQSSNVVQVVYITTQECTNPHTHVDISTKTINRTAKCEQVVPVDKSRISEYKGYVSKAQLKAISEAMAYNLKIDTKPNKPKHENVLKTLDKTMSAMV